MAAVVVALERVEEAGWVPNRVGGRRHLRVGLLLLLQEPIPNRVELLLLLLLLLVLLQPGPIANRVGVGLLLLFLVLQGLIGTRVGVRLLLLVLGVPSLGRSIANRVGVRPLVLPLPA